MNKKLSACIVVVGNGWRQVAYFGAGLIALFSACKKTGMD